MEKYIALNCKQKKSQNKKMKYNKTKKILLMSIIVCAIMLIFPQPAAAAFKYVLLEAFPGFFTKGQELTDLPEMVLAIYKFGIWTAGICGLLMMTVGGVMYMGSAGNNAAAESAKKIISDSLLGIIVALGAYLFIYVINPDLANITINFTKATLDSSGKTSSSTGETVTGESTTKTTVSCSSATGKCSKVDDAISKNASGVDGKILKTLIAGGEGCNNNHSSDGKSCGYGQVQYKYMRSICGLSGTDSELCTRMKSDTQLDINCTAKFVKTQTIPCAKKVFGNTEASSVGSCYNAGYTGKCGTSNYCQRTQNYYNSCT